MNIKHHFLKAFFFLLSAGVILIAVILFFPSSSPATSVIKWTPASITETISPGGSKVINVSFTSSEDIDNVTVRVVPELEPFIQVEPTSFSQIAIGQTVNLDIILSAGQDSPLGTFDGTVQLRAGSNTMAKPLPVEVNIGQRYSDPEGRYSVMFPSDIEAEVVENSLVLKQPSGEEGEEQPSLRFSIDPNPDGLTVEEYYDGNPGRDLIGQSGGIISPIMVGGVSAFKFVPIVSFAGEVIVVVPRDREFIRIIDDGSSFQEGGLFELILETLEF